MIQRIQSIYLLLAAILLATLFFLPYAAFGGDGGSASFNILGGETIYPDGLAIVDKMNLVLLILTSINIGALLAAIFLFKNRKAQLALVYTSMLSILFIMAVMGYYIYGYIQFYMTKNIALDFDVVRSFGLFIPIISFILAYMAARGIKRDEELVRSADRIR